MQSASRFLAQFNLDASPLTERWLGDAGGWAWLGCGGRGWFFCCYACQTSQPAHLLVVTSTWLAGTHVLLLVCIYGVNGCILHILYDMIFIGIAWRGWSAADMVLWYAMAIYFSLNKYWCSTWNG